LPAGAALQGAVYQEALEPLGPSARVVAKFGDGAPAMIASRHGRGQTLMVGSFLSLAYTRTRDRNLEEFFQGLLDWAGVERPASASDPAIEMRSLEGRDYALYFIFNNGEKEANAEIKLQTPFSNISIRDLVTEQPVQFQTAGNRVTLRRTMAPQAVWVLEVREKQEAKR